MSTENDWAAGLPDDLKAVVSAKGFKAPADVVKSYHELESRLGTSIRIPGPDATEKDRSEFLEKLLKTSNGRLVDLPAEDDKVVEGLRAAGRLPKEAKDYALEGVEFQPGTELSEQEQQEFRSWAHSRGLTKGAAKAELERLAKARAEGVKALKANEQALRSEFGQAFDDKMKGYRILAEKIGAPSDLKAAIEKNAITKEQAAWLDRIGKAIGVETREVAALETHQSPKLTTAELRARKKEALNKANDMTVSAEERSEAFRHVAEIEEALEKFGG